MPKRVAVSLPQLLDLDDVYFYGSEFYNDDIRNHLAHIPDPQQWVALLKGARKNTLDEDARKIGTTENKALQQKFAPSKYGSMPLLNFGFPDASSCFVEKTPFIGSSVVLSKNGATITDKLSPLVVNDVVQIQIELTRDVMKGTAVVSKVYHKSVMFMMT
jgi:hypothetical protein